MFTYLYHHSLPAYVLWPWGLHITLLLGSKQRQETLSISSAYPAPCHYPLTGHHLNPNDLKNPNSRAVST